MSYYTVTVREIRVIGGIWMPYGLTCAQIKTLTPHDVANIGELTRENCEQWLLLNAGDFSSIDDFQVDIEDFFSDWEKEESELTFNDCMFGSADDF